jgi:hypothetical protein
VTVVCFSATASFVASGALAGVGAATLYRNEAPQLRMFAAVPLVFAAQQACEGVVWLTTMGATPGRGLAQLAVVAYLSVALVLWPSWLPLSLRAAEPSPERRKVLTGLSIAGLLVSAFCAMALALWPAAARVRGHHITYDFSLGVGEGTILPVLAYFIPTAVPLFVSSLSLSRILGVVLLIALAATVVAQRAALTSVWCFFAAILSALILAIVMRAQPAALAKSH